MLAELVVFSHALLAPSLRIAARLRPPRARSLSTSTTSIFGAGARLSGLRGLRLSVSPAGPRSRLTPMAFASPTENQLLHDAGAAVLTAGVALGLLRFWEELVKRGVLEQVRRSV